MAIHFTTPLTVSRSQSLTQEPYHQYVILHMTDHSFTHSVYDETSRLATVQSQWSEWCAVSSELAVTSVKVQVHKCYVADPIPQR